MLQEVCKAVQENFVHVFSRLFFFFFFAEKVCWKSVQWSNHRFVCDFGDLGSQRMDGLKKREIITVL